MSKPICRHCVAEVQLFKQCGNLSAGHCAAGVQLFKRCGNLSASSVLQGCSCLSGVETYLQTLYCWVSAVKVVLKPICRYCVAEVQLFKGCQKPICRHWVAGVQLFKQCRNLSAVTVLLGCSCFSSIATYLPALCCRGAAF